MMRTIILALAILMGVLGIGNGIFMLPALVGIALTIWAYRQPRIGPA
jgi:hypothetical protein